MATPKLDLKALRAAAQSLAEQHLTFALDPNELLALLDRLAKAEAFINLFRDNAHLSLRYLLGCLDPAAEAYRAKYPRETP